MITVIHFSYLFDPGSALEPYARPVIEYALPLPSYIHIHPFNGPSSGTTQVGRYQKGKTNLDFTEARDSEWQWHQLGHMQVCTSLQTDNHASTPPLSFLQAGCPSCRPTNSVKALKALYLLTNTKLFCRFSSVILDRTFTMLRLL